MNIVKNNPCHVTFFNQSMNGVYNMWPITSKQGSCRQDAFQDITPFVCEKNKENKKKLRLIFDHKIAMLHPIYTWVVSSLS